MRSILGAFPYLCLWVGLGCGPPATEESPSAIPRKQVDELIDDSAADENHLTAYRAALPTDWFEDITASSQVAFVHRNGREGGRYLMIESFGGGVAMVDFDLDDRIDLFFTGGGEISADDPLRIRGRPCGLFRNLGELRFAATGFAHDLSRPVDYSQGCAVADFNVDGFPDLFVCCYGQNRLFCNQGDGTFVDETNAEVFPYNGWATAAAFGDLDQDGLPDLFLAHYADWTPELDVACVTEQQRDLCGPTSFGGTSCQFFRNSADGTFEEVSKDVGIVGGAHGLGVLVTDLNADGLIDFYVSCDALPNQLYIGQPNHTFHEAAVLAGVSSGEWGQPEGGMGLAAGDYNGDGAIDIFVTNFENEDNALYQNTGQGSWVHHSAACGLSGVSRRVVGFGTALCDFNADGWLDLFVLNGNPIYKTAETPYKQQPQLFQNVNGQRFVDASTQAAPYFEEVHSGRGSATGDLDNDGAHDLVIVLMNEPVRVLRNLQPPENSLTVQLHARFGERDAVGAHVTCDLNGRTLARWVTKGTGFFSEADPRIIFPVAPDVGQTEVIVHWPGRSQERFGQLATRQIHHLVEGQGQQVP